MGGDQLHKGAGSFAGLDWEGGARGACVQRWMPVAPHTAPVLPPVPPSPFPEPGGSPGCELGVAPCSLLLKANHLEESFGAKAAFKGNIGSLVWLQQRLLC